MSWTEITMEDIHATNFSGRQDFIKKLQWHKIINKNLVSKYMKPNIDRDLVINPKLIGEIPHPTIEQQLLAIANDPYSIRHINDPCDEAINQAVASKWDTIKIIKNPTPLAVALGLRISRGDDWINNIDKDIIIDALKIDGQEIYGIKKQDITPEMIEAAWNSPTAKDLLSQHDWSYIISSYLRINLTFRLILQ